MGLAGCFYRCTKPSSRDSNPEICTGLPRRRYQVPSRGERLRSRRCVGRGGGHRASCNAATTLSCPARRDTWQIRACVVRAQRHADGVQTYQTGQQKPPQGTRSARPARKLPRSQTTTTHGLRHRAARPAPLQRQSRGHPRRWENTPKRHEKAPANAKPCRLRHRISQPAVQMHPQVCRHAAPASAQIRSA